MSFTLKAALVAGATAAAALVGGSIANAETIVRDEEGTWYEDPAYDTDDAFIPASAETCHHVRRFTTDEFGDRVQIRARMCYDEYGRSYIVPGTRHVLREY